MGKYVDSKLAEIEDDRPVGVWCYRTVSVQLSVKSNSEENALDIGHCLLQHMKDEEIIGPSDGNVILGP